MAFKKNMRNFGKRQGNVGTKFLRGVDNISKKNRRSNI
jgi:hypothetical protein